MTSTISTIQPISLLHPGIFHAGGHISDPELPEDSPTIGYKLNHFMLRIKDPARTLHFYCALMGMRTVFTFNGGPFTIYYLGYPATEHDRSDLTAWASHLCAGNISQTLGLLELKHIHGSEAPLKREDTKFPMEINHLTWNLDI